MSPPPVGDTPLPSDPPDQDHDFGPALFPSDGSYSDTSDDGLPEATSPSTTQNGYLETIDLTADGIPAGDGAIFHGVTGERSTAWTAPPGHVPDAGTTPIFPLTPSDSTRQDTAAAPGVRGPAEELTCYIRRADRSFIYARVDIEMGITMATLKSAIASIFNFGSDFDMYKDTRGCAGVSPPPVMHHSDALVRLWAVADIQAGDYLAAVPDAAFLGGPLRARGVDACRYLALQTLATLEEAIMVTDHSLADELVPSSF